MTSSRSFTDFAARGAKKSVGVVGFGMALHVALEYLFPGHASTATGAAAGGAALVATHGQVIKDFVEHLYSKLSSLFVSYEANEYFADTAEEMSEHRRRFNHDIELQVGRTLSATLVEFADTKAEASKTLAKFVRALALRASEEPKSQEAPPWALALESAGVEFRLSAFRDICLNGGRLAPGELLLSPADWSKFLKELAKDLQGSDTFEQYDGLWKPLSGYLEKHLPARFYNHMTTALTDPAHAKAWAAMQYRIEALILAEIQSISRAAESAASSASEAKLQALETRQAVLVLGSHCAADASSLWERLDATEQKMLTNLRREVDLISVTIESRLNTISGQIDELRRENTEDHRVLNQGIADVRQDIQAIAERQAEDSSKLASMQKKSPTPEEILRFEVAYTEVCTQFFNRIRVHSSQWQSESTIDDLYVFPQFHLFRPGQITPLSYDDVRLRLHRTVVIGEPGGGKTTLTKKLCFDAASREVRRVLAKRSMIPVLVRLRDYSKLREQPRSIAGFIADNATLQVPTNTDAIEYLLFSGRLLVVFDGLDEILDLSVRRNVADDIMAFSILYPDAPILVTCRAHEYQETPLDQDRFELIRLGPFTDKQISEYAVKWFGRLTESTELERTQLREAFLNEITTVSDLASNPLMLALLCSLYKAERQIPQDRPSLYGACAHLLYKRWDILRGIELPFPFESHIEPLLRHLAQWMYDKAYVTRSQLVAECTYYLHPRRFVDRNDALAAAEAFVDLCTGRKWVFSDIEAVPGMLSYGFTHRTFLEYFCAGHLASTNDTPRKLAACVLRALSTRDLGVVEEIAFQLKAESLDGAADELLEAILAQVRRGPEREKGRLLWFAVRMLGSLVPSPETVGHVVEACLRYFTAVGYDAEANSPFTSESTMSPGHLLEALLTSRADNHKNMIVGISGALKRIKATARKEKESVITKLQLHLSRALPDAIAQLSNAQQRKVQSLCEMLQSVLSANYTE